MLCLEYFKRGKKDLIIGNVGTILMDFQKSMVVYLMTYL